MNWSTNQIPSRDCSAGISTRVTKKTMKIRVITLAAGNKSAYPPSTPATVPLAPIVGAVELGSRAA